ncbi:Vacuolar protein sorting-associated protein 35B [Porphyridium purpureum]|uniref:Vacuolar protein sorting-associated protein 35B n=1 Tax=Porphyridium purpureum TaxID=35688 RepID=A0A5J4Z7G9_PORPP|nr:Vacuolar protein sorting-associated protein 35B [Porphyridium purpureum]|eukprot:POR4439..scf295_1
MPKNPDAADAAAPCQQRSVSAPAKWNTALDTDVQLNKSHGSNCTFVQSLLFAKRWTSRKRRLSPTVSAIERASGSEESFCAAANALAHTRKRARTLAERPFLLAAGGIMSAIQLSGDESRLHREASANVRLKAQRLRAALAADLTDDALVAAADVALELKAGTAASALSPKLYYDVYLAVTGELRVLEAYLYELARSGVSMLEVYEKVQATPAAIPRLYMMITVASVFVKSMQKDVHDMLGDLTEMCRAVQHSVRGLFLRAYLVQAMKDKLPDEEDSTPSSGASSAAAATPALPTTAPKAPEAIEFLLANFAVMNRLWVRMQHDSPTVRNDAKSRERRDLRLLVGSNISTLSRLSSLSFERFKGIVLPFLCDQIVRCGDATAQEYLADCIVQVFPDEFLLQTIHEFLSMCSKVSERVNMRSIISSLSTRLSRFASSNSTDSYLASTSLAFEAFREWLPVIMEYNVDSMSKSDMLGIYLSVLQFALKAHPDKLEYVDNVFALCVKVLSRGSAKPQSHSADASSPRAQKSSADPATGASTKTLGTAPDVLSEFSQEETLVFQILSAPLSAHQSIPVALQLKQFPELVAFLCFRTRQRAAAALLQCQPHYTPCIALTQELHVLFNFIAPLLDDGVQSKSDDTESGTDSVSAAVYHPYLFPREQATSSRVGASPAVPAASAIAPREDESLVRIRVMVDECERLVSKVIYLIDSPNVLHRYNMYRTLRTRLRISSHLGWGVMTLPTLIYNCFSLVLDADETKVRQRDSGKDVGPCPDVEAVLQFLTELLVEYAPLREECALQLYCQAAVTASRCKSLPLANRSVVLEYFSNALSLHETSRELSSSNRQFLSLIKLVSTLQHLNTLRGLDAEDYAVLSNRMVRYAHNLLARAEQVLALSACTLLFWNPVQDAANSAERTESISQMSEQVLNVIGLAMASSRRCLSNGEQALCLIDILVRCVYLIEAGCDRIRERGFVRELIGTIHAVLDFNVKKSSAVYKLCMSRLHRSVSYMRRKPEIFDFVVHE